MKEVVCITTLPLVSPIKTPVSLSLIHTLKRRPNQHVGKNFLKGGHGFCSGGVDALVVLIFNGNPASTRAARLAVMMKSKIEAVEDRSPVPPSMPNPPTYLPAPQGSSSSPP